MPASLRRAESRLATRDALIVRRQRIRRKDDRTAAVVHAACNALAAPVALIDIDILRVETATFGQSLHGLFTIIGAARAAHERKRSDRHDEQIHRFHDSKNAF